MMQFKIDLHTHSTASPDGGISRSQYHKILDQGTLHYIAVTDHNSIKLAEQLHQELGERIIIGEEIMTSAGEIVGLYLREAISPGLSPLETVKHIKQQGGIVYIPHPFETMRKGLHPSVLDEIMDYIDVIEVCNGRAFLQNLSAQAVVWARLNQKVGAASSDAHGIKGLGKTYTIVGGTPDRDTLVELLKNGTPCTAPPSVRALLYPKYHRFRKKVLRRP